MREKDGEFIRGEFFNFRDEYAVGSYIERNIKAEFSERILSWREVVKLLDSNERAKELVRRMMDVYPDMCYINLEELMATLDGINYWGGK